jgi:uncharacterized membrane protein
LPAFAPYNPEFARVPLHIPEHRREARRHLPQPRPTPTRATPNGPSLESLIGKNWTSWVGAIVVVIGVLFFLKYAWDQGWLVLPPAARVWATIAAGAASIAAGQYLHRKSMRVLSASLIGLGVAVAMAACFAASTLFQPAVFSRSGATAGVLLTAAVGIALAVRTNTVSLAIVALLGAYVAPAVLTSHQDQSLALMAYLAALAGIGLALSYLKPRWGALRIFTWVCTATWMLAWTLAYGHKPEHRALAVVSIGVFYLAFLAESFFTLQRAPTDGRQDTTLATLSLLSTAVAFGGFYAVLDPAGSARDGLLILHPMSLVAIALAGLHSGLAVATPARQFSRSSVIQSAILVTLAVPLVLGQFAITLAWLALAAGLAALSTRMKDGAAARLGAVALVTLALIRVFTLDLFNPALKSSWFILLGQSITPWLLLAWVGAVGAHVVGWFVSDDRAGADKQKAWTELGLVAAGLGTVGFLLATAIVIKGIALTLVACAALAALIALARRRQSLAYPAQAAILAAVLSFKWLFIDGLARAFDQWSQPGTHVIPVFNEYALTGLALIALIIWLIRRAATGQARQIAGVCAAALAFAWLNFEVLRLVNFMGGAFADVGKAKHVALSILWGLTGLAGVLVGFNRRLQSLRYAALGLLGVTLFKVMIIDMATVQAVYRILSFIAVGGLLLCVSYVYHKHLDNEDAAIPD